MKYLLLIAAIVGFLLSIGAAFASEGYATYYTTKSCQREGTSGVRTANGERFNEAALTCALPTRNFGSLWLVTNLDNGLSIIARQTDYGPGKTPIRRGVIIDLTPAAFKALGAGKKGKIRVCVKKAD
jgi:rare lipoprotein A